MLPKFMPKPMNNEYKIEPPKSSRSLYENIEKGMNMGSKWVPKPCQNGSENRCQTKSKKTWMDEPAANHPAGRGPSPIMAKIN